jgi:NitT/TauT family transport system substrate-binding protein
MQGRRWWWLVAALVAAGLLVAAGCGGDAEDLTAPADEPAAPAEEPAETEDDAEEPREADQVTLQLKWVTQAQFAGFYAALEQGFYEDEGLDVTIRPGGPDIVPEQVVLGRQAEFGINWLDNTLATRDQGGRIVNIAQVFTRSGMTQIAWADSDIEDIEDLRGRRVGVWLGGNEHKLFAALTKNGLDPQDDVTIVAQPFDMNLFINREVDAAAAMTYNELAQVLAQRDPETGQQYTLDDLVVMRMSDVGTGALEDGIFVREDWIEDEANQDVARRFVKASLRGWIYCRDNPDDCVEFVLNAGPTLGENHQRWMMNEINALIWPAQQGIGVMDSESWEITAQIAEDFGIVDNPPEDAAYRTDIAEAAVNELRDEGEDVTGEDWQQPEVQIEPADG